MFRRNLAIVSVAIVCAHSVGATLAGAEQDGPQRIWRDVVYDVSTSEPVPASSAEVRYFEDRADFRITTAGLVAGNAYTIWVMIFNHSENCAQGDWERERGLLCGPGDERNPSSLFSMTYGAGKVADSDGKVTFAGSLHRFDPNGVYVPPGYANPANAEIHLRVRDHGPYQGPTTLQTTTLMGGCENRQCADVQSTGW